MLSLFRFSTRPMKKLSTQQTARLFERQRISEKIYWSIKVGGIVLENSVWSYGDLLPEAHKIKDCLCFYNEKVDAIYLDNELVPKPDTPWS
ncbi:MAG TPA: DUF427 domain-containing protein [Rhodospirillales bacterium]|nr:DUF427 domain-containing protein [Rhodospirillales bacterium]